MHQARCTPFLTLLQELAVHNRQLLHNNILMKPPPVLYAALWSRASVLAMHGGSALWLAAMLSSANCSLIQVRPLHPAAHQGMPVCWIQGRHQLPMCATCSQTSTCWVAM